VKVLGSNGKYYTRDHPHEIISPHVMTFETIRFWMRELTSNPEYGWTKAGLERTLGIPAATLKQRLTVKWIWPKEQVRFTARLNEILEGRIVPRLVGARQRQEGVYVDPPQPPKVSATKELKFTTRIKGLPFADRPGALPQFGQAFRGVAMWDPDKKKAR
jgi:hypothetical protein